MGEVRITAADKGRGGALGSETECAQSSRIARLDRSLGMHLASPSFNARMQAVAKSESATAFPSVP